MCDCSVVLEELARAKREVEELKSKLADTRARLNLAEQYVPREMD